MSAEPLLDTTYPALMLKASRRTDHHGALGVARSLGGLGVPVYAVVEDNFTPLANSRYLTKAFVWKSWPCDGDAFLVAMSKLADIINHKAILIPLDDLCAVTVAENASVLSQWFLLPEVANDVARQLANKATFYSLCASNGIPCARSVVARSADDVYEFASRSTFPIVVKAAEQWRLINARYNIKILPTREALMEFCKNIEFGEHLRMVLQEYVPGQDWIYHGYCNQKTNLYLSFTGRKLLNYPPGGGATAIGLACGNEMLRRQSEKLLRVVAYSGISDIDFRQDERDGQYKVMDCNPRIGMNFRMFENSVGIDVVRALHLDLTGRKVDCTEMIKGRRFIVESYYLLSCIRGGSGALAAEAGKHLHPKKRELAWWDGDDKLPFFVMTVRLLYLTMRYMLRSVRKRATRDLSP